LNTDDLASILLDLGISAAEIARRALPFCAEPNELVVVEIDDDGREHRLAPAAANAWQQLRDAASHDGIELQIVSAFRSIDRQVELIQRKLAAGQSIAEILRASAPPGYSEHHSGCAIDVGTPDSPPLEVDFEATSAYAWLTANAHRFGFTLSYPPDNPHGYQYEPWHWRFTG
jgi:D-alanyl-D-alanine carboxypeptidase